MPVWTPGPSAGLDPWIRRRRGRLPELWMAPVEAGTRPFPHLMKSPLRGGRSQAQCTLGAPYTESVYTSPISTEVPRVAWAPPPSQRQSSTCCLRPCKKTVLLDAAFHP